MPSVLVWRGPQARVPDLDEQVVYSRHADSNLPVSSEDAELFENIVSDLFKAIHPEVSRVTWHIIESPGARSTAGG